LSPRHRSNVDPSKSRLLALILNLSLNLRISFALHCAFSRPFRSVPFQHFSISAFQLFALHGYPRLSTAIHGYPRQNFFSKTGKSISGFQRFSSTYLDQNIFSARAFRLFRLLVPFCFLLSVFQLFPQGI
jgi:hypothetical protein